MYQPSIYPVLSPRIFQLFFAAQSTFTWGLKDVLFIHEARIVISGSKRSNESGAESFMNTPKK